MSKYGVSKIVTVIVVAALLIIGFVQRDALSGVFYRLTNSGPVQEVLGLVNNQGFLPAPLRFNGNFAGTLTRAGVIQSTNDQRVKFSLLPLHENAKLDQAAELKVKDMFDKQYFEHVSPSGVGPSDLANQVEYKYLVIGQNLALGNFKDDADLVQAWMNSPGHRANILHDKFQEIGVAVGQGTFEGKTVWLAVQSFGTPSSVCPSPDASVQTAIKQGQTKIDSLQQQANNLQAELIQMQGHSSRADYNNKVDQYNLVVREINALIATQKNLVNQFNASVNSFNTCLGEKS